MIDKIKARIVEIQDTMKKIKEQYDQLVVQYNVLVGQEGEAKNILAQIEAETLKHAAEVVTPEVVATEVSAHADVNASE